MRVMRDSSRQVHGYSLDDAADFLEYDRSAIEYWLRMGHLSGEWDDQRSTWKIRPQAIIDFLRQSREPMPTGATRRGRASTSRSGAVAAEAAGD
jgi:hypothetical protein